MKHKVLALAISANIIFGTAALAAGEYYEGQGYVRVHDSVGQGYDEQNDELVYGPFYIHLHGFTPGEVVRVKVENRGFHPTDPYGKVAGPFNITIDEKGFGRTEYLSLPPQEYKVKIQLNYGTAAEVKDYFNFEVRENSGSVPEPSPTPEPTPYPTPTPPASAAHQLSPGGSITVRCN